MFTLVFEGFNLSPTNVVTYAHHLANTTPKWLIEPGGVGKHILVSTGPFREIMIRTNTPKSSLFDALKNAEIERRVPELSQF